MKIQGEPCPICKRAREYISEVNALKGKDKPCRSCANSISAGGKGWTDLCFDCGVNKREQGRSSLCRPCAMMRSKEYYRSTFRWSKYGLSGPIEMVECEICGDKDDLVIDHCHETNAYRGVLCRTCNMGIGHLKENKDVIRKALEYAERTFNG
jgi:hypothetical protein